MRSFAALDLQKLPRDVDALLGVITDLHTQYSTTLESLHQQLQNLRRMHFGATNEKLCGQAELFQQTQKLPVPPQDPVTITYTRQRRGWPSLPKDLPRECVDYDLSDAEKAEFDALERIGEEVSETLEYTPAKLIVIEHVRAKYACRRHGESTIPAPPSRNPRRCPRPMPVRGCSRKSWCRPLPTICRFIVRRRSSGVTGWICRARRYASGSLLPGNCSAYCAPR
jgi:hypothetical protein